MRHALLNLCIIFFTSIYFISCGQKKSIQTYPLINSSAYTTITTYGLKEIWYDVRNVDILSFPAWFPNKTNSISPGHLINIAEKELKKHTPSGQKWYVRRITISRLQCSTQYLRTLSRSKNKWIYKIIFDSTINNETWQIPITFCGTTIHGIERPMRIESEKFIKEILLKPRQTDQYLSSGKYTGLIKNHLNDLNIDTEVTTLVSQEELEKMSSWSANKPLPVSFSKIYSAAEYSLKNTVANYNDWYLEEIRIQLVQNFNCSNNKWLYIFEYRNKLHPEIFIFNGKAKLYYINIPVSLYGGTFHSDKKTSSIKTN